MKKLIFVSLSEICAQSYGTEQILGYLHKNI